MKMNMDALKALELKLAEYSQENGAIAEHTSSNMNDCNCSGKCISTCQGTCRNACTGSCRGISS